MWRVAVFVAIMLVLLVFPLVGSTYGFFGNIPSNNSEIQSDIYFGWATNGWITDLSLGAKGESLFNESESKYQYKTSAPYLETSFSIPLESLGTLTLSIGGQIPGSELPGRQESLIPLFTIPEWSSWVTDTYWAKVDSLLAYPVYGPGTWYALVGFRWDYWQTSFIERSDRSATWFWLDSTDSADLTVNVFAPFLGVMTSMGGLKFGALGSPVVFGNVLLNENRNGLLQNRKLNIEEPFDPLGSCLIEVFSEYDFLPDTFGFSGYGDDLKLSFFGKLIWVETKNDNANLAYSGDVVDNKFFDLRFRRGIFVIGGKAQLNFNLPNFDGYF